MSNRSKSHEMKRPVQRRMNDNIQKENIDWILELIRKKYTIAQIVEITKYPKPLIKRIFKQSL